MSIQFSKVKNEQFKDVYALYQAVIADMHKSGLKQWEWEVYPTSAQLEQDIQSGVLYRVEEVG